MTLQPKINRVTFTKNYLIACNKSSYFIFWQLNCTCDEMTAYGLSTRKKVSKYSYNLGVEGKCDIVRLCRDCPCNKRTSFIFYVECSYLVQWLLMVLWLQQMFQIAIWLCQNWSHSSRSHKSKIARNLNLIFILIECVYIWHIFWIWCVDYSQSFRSRYDFGVISQSHIQSILKSV